MYPFLQQLISFLLHFLNECNKNSVYQQVLLLFPKKSFLSLPRDKLQYNIPKKNKIVFFLIEKFLFNKFILSLTPYGRVPSQITKGIRQSIIINFNISCVINIIPNTIAGTSKIDKKIKLGRTEKFVHRNLSFIGPWDMDSQSTVNNLLVCCCHLLYYYFIYFRLYEILIKFNNIFSGE